MVVHWKFVNAQHEKQYQDVTTMLQLELERQKSDAARLVPEWDRLPEELRRKNMAWLAQHFAECRKPYIDLLTRILSLATPVWTVPVNEI